MLDVIFYYIYNIQLVICGFPQIELGILELRPLRNWAWYYVPGIQEAKVGGPQV